MATFDSTEGGAAANSYASLDYAKDYLALDYGAGDFLALDDADMEKLLKKLGAQAESKDVMSDEQIQARAQAIAAMWSDETPKDVRIKRFND